MTITIYRRDLPEMIVTGKRLGRHVYHDSRSLAYLVPAGRTVASWSWKRDTPILDQGNVGSCTGNATVGVLGTDPFVATLPATDTLDETQALALYSAAEKVDGGVGYPPEDQGSTGLSVAKAAKNVGLISGYQHITSVAAAKTAIQAGPFIVGSNWYESMDSPDSRGLVTIGGAVRGGHEYECLGYDAANDVWALVNSWGTSWGLSGRFFYSSTTFARLLSEQGDATVFTPISAPAPTPTPAPTPAPTVDPHVVTFHDAVIGWANARHVGSNKAAATAARALFTAEGLAE